MITGMMLRFDSLEHHQQLNDEQYGRLIRAALVFAKSRAEAEVGEQREPKLSTPECYLWPGLRMAIIQDQESYKAKCEQNRKNIAGYWAGQRQQEQPEAEDTTEYDRIRPDTNNNIMSNIMSNPNVKSNSNVMSNLRDHTVDQLRSEGFADWEIEKAITRAATRSEGKTIRNLEAYIRQAIKDERAKRRAGKRVPAQDYNQRDYSGVQDELIAEQDREMEEYMRREKEGGNQ